MKLVRSYNSVSEECKNSVSVIGNFDGVHLGHMAVIERARRAAAQSGRPLAAITFEPHPRQFFEPNSSSFRLMSAEAKAHRLEKVGIQVLFELPFDTKLSSMSAESFAKVVLSEGLGVALVFVGRDFRYGKMRQGDIALLASDGLRYGFEVQTVPIVSQNGVEHSSTSIRNALEHGQPEQAALILGHWHRIEGKVHKGQNRGRKLGFPTANLSLKGLHIPKFGVYAAFVDILTGSRKGNYLGAVSIGIRPTFGENPPNLEVHLLDFDNTLYEEQLSVALVRYIRPEIKFDSLDRLVEQMQDDCNRTREILRKISTNG